MDKFGFEIVKNIILNKLLLMKNQDPFGDFRSYMSSEPSLFIQYSYAISQMQNFDELSEFIALEVVPFMFGRNRPFQYGTHHIDWVGLRANIKADDNLIQQQLYARLDILEEIYNTR